MDPERARIQDDLRGLLDGDVRCDDLTRQMYASDASIYELQPLGVVRPTSTADVIACVRYARENQLTLHPRGAGTGVAGESLGRGLVIDFAHNMRRILQLEEGQVRLQPGVVLSDLNAQLRSARAGWMFGPDPATRSVTTMGSVLSLDASGSHWLQFGSARDHVEQLRVVTGRGEVLEAGQVDLASATDETVEGRYARQVAGVIERHAETIRQHRPKSKVNRCGYHLHDILQNGQLDLARLLVGSEGTLGLITEATVRLVPRPKHRGVVLLFFERLEAAARAAIEIAEMQVAACDLMDRRLLSIAREQDVRYEMMIPALAEAMLLVECAADDLGTLREQMEQIIYRMQRKKRLAFDSRSTVEIEERNAYWRLTRRVIPTLYRLEGSTRALPFIEDVAVPVAALPSFLVTLQNLLKAHQVTASIFAHAGHGQLHIRPFLDLTSPVDSARIEPLARELYQAVADVKGSMSGEHGVGLSRTWFMRRFNGPLYSVFAEIKQIFDPEQLLNRGKVVADTPQSPADNLRPAPVAVSPTLAGGETASAASSPTAPAAAGEPLVASTTEGTSPLPQLDVLQPEYPWQPHELFQTARACNGCGRCRTLNADERMCPIFRAQPHEEASPRAKANLMRGLLTGQLPPELIHSDEFKAIADLCVNCHQCRLECPASVDIPRLMLEAKAQYVRNNGLKFSQLVAGRIESLVAAAATVRPLANWAITRPSMRWLLDRTLGIAQGRKLPRLASRSFLKIAAKQRLTRMNRGGDRKVALFIDTYANHCDPHLAECFVSILRHNGIAVYVPPGQLPSGMPLITQGLSRRAQGVARHNVEIFSEAIRQGYHVVAIEPSAALCLKHEYRNLLDDDDTRLVADNSSEACDYLWKLHQNGHLELDFRPLNYNLGYHLPCHQRAVAPQAPGERLLQLVPGLSVERINRGCSGMAGTWGLLRQNYYRSFRMGRGLIASLRQPGLSLGVTECSTCRMQMEQSNSKPTLHPLKLLALAYHLHPEVSRLCERRGQPLTLSS